MLSGGGSEGGAMPLPLFGVPSGFTQRLRLLSDGVHCVPFIMLCCLSAFLAEHQTTLYLLHATSTAPILVTRARQLTAHSSQLKQRRVRAGVRRLNVVELLLGAAAVEEVFEADGGGACAEAENDPP